MRALLSAALIALMLSAGPAAALKRVPYPEIRVTPLPAFSGDPALTEVRKHMAAAVEAKNLDAVIALVSASFEWTAGGVPVDEFDAKRSGEHNFRVAFGFRSVGRDTDGPTDIGPLWDLLAFFANDPIQTQDKDSPLVCGSVTAKPADLAALDEAFNRIDEETELSEWVYATGELQLTDKPGGTGVAKISGLALPVLDIHPAPPEGGGEAAPPTHFELMLPSGKSGWAAVNAVRPLFVDRLCFEKTNAGWKIAVYDQAE